MHGIVLPMHTPHRDALCYYFSPDKKGLFKEVETAYRACCTAKQSQQREQSTRSDLLAIVVPHGAACDGFFVAASAYRRLCDHLHSRRCRHLTAVLLGTEHRGTTPVAASRLDWATPLGTAHVDTAAVDFLTQQHGIPVLEAPHATEHSLENQLPFLLHGAAHNWDLSAAGCDPDEPPASTAAAAAAASTAAATAGAAGGRDVVSAASAGLPAAAAPVSVPASLSIVPISIGYLGNQPHLIQSVGAAVASLLKHLRQKQQQQQQQHQQGQQQQQQQQQQAAATPNSSSGREVVLVVTSDFTHAGPGYRELPPAGVSLQDYMARQDTPVLQAIQAGSVDALLSAAAATRNSMCGLYPLAVALEALYGSSSSSGSSGGSSGGCSPAKPELLDYRAAHTIFDRPDSTGFAAFAVYAQP